MSFYIYVYFLLMFRSTPRAKRTDTLLPCRTLIRTILVDGQPAADHLGSERLVRRRRREAQKIPARIDESVEGVGLAHRFAAARWALSMLPRRMATQRI